MTTAQILITIAVIVVIGLAMYFFARSVFDKAKSEFTTRTLVLIPIAIAINIAIGELVVRLKLPVYLDSIGTVLVGALAGPWAGMVTGALANLIWGFITPAAAPFFYVAAVIGLIAGLAGRRGAFEKESPRWLSTIIGGVFFFALSLFVMAFLFQVRGIPGDYETMLAPTNPDYASGEVIRWDPAGEQPFLFPSDPGYTDGGVILASAADLIAFQPVVFIIAALIGVAIGYFLLNKAGYAGLWGIVTGIVAAIISAPTAAYVFYGVTGAGTDLLVAAFRASGAPLLASVLAQGSVSDPFDKMVSYMVVWLILGNLPARFKTR